MLRFYSEAVLLKCYLAFSDILMFCEKNAMMESCAVASTFTICNFSKESCRMVMSLLKTDYKKRRALLNEDFFNSIFYIIANMRQQIKKVAG